MRHHLQELHHQAAQPRRGRLRPAPTATAQPAPGAGHPNLPRRRSGRHRRRQRQPPGPTRPGRSANAADHPDAGGGAVQSGGRTAAGHVPRLAAAAAAERRRDELLHRQCDDAQVSNSVRSVLIVIFTIISTRFWNEFDARAHKTNTLEHTLLKTQQRRRGSVLLTHTRTHVRECVVYHCTIPIHHKTPHR